MRYVTLKPSTDAYPSVNILYPFREGPWGGANQFLKALRVQLEAVNVYEANPRRAPVILVNSHHCLWQSIMLKCAYPSKVVIHRIDGPVSLVRGRDDGTDRLIYSFTSLVADAVVFQSRWSMERNLELGFELPRYSAVIPNAPDPAIFYAKARPTAMRAKKRLIASSWSANPRKGFDVLQFLDSFLDWGRYEMTFVGNSPVVFRHIKMHPPVGSAQLADILREHDIYVAPMLNDPSSNALTEALHCGLPAVARRSGGNPEILGEAGELFDELRDSIRAIDRVAPYYDYYASKIRVIALSQVAEMYMKLASQVWEDVMAGRYRPKRVEPKLLLRFANLWKKFKLRQFWGTQVSG